MGAREQVRGGRRLIGVLLAAGRSRRLGSIVDETPKSLLPVKGDTPIMEVILKNLREVDVTDVAIVTGYRADMIEERIPGWQQRYGLAIETIYNPTFMEWNNCYSLWLARDRFAEGMFVINADTVHPVQVEQTLLAHRGPDILLAVDDVKQLGEEELKVKLDADGWVELMTKQIAPEDADGEHIGVSLVEGRIADELADCLKVTWERDPVRLYFEDGYNEFVRRGGKVGHAPIGAVRWVEVDNADDYQRAEQIASEYQ